jgi:hypothetical protein
VNGHGHHRQVRTLRRGECAAHELADAAPLIERALGEEHQGLAHGCDARYPARVGRALVSVEPLHEFRAQAPQQQTRQRYAHHLLLDHEGEVRRQRGDGDDPVDIAGMVRDHHAGTVRQAVLAENRYRNA